MQPLLLSLKPIYADLIFDGFKTAELRRRIVSQIENCEVFVYVTSPVRQLRGGFRVGQVWSGSPEDVWKDVSGFAAVGKREFEAYYAGRAIAYALQVTDVWSYMKPVGLSELRSEFPNFVVPQSWRYVKPEEHPKFRPAMNQITRFDSDCEAEVGFCDLR